MQPSLSFSDVLSALGGMDEETQATAIAEADKLLQGRCWVPNVGPQTMAYFSEADELFYGGQAGGGKSALMLGLSVTEHERSLILRRTNKEASGLVDAMAELLGSRDGYTSHPYSMWRYQGRQIDFGGCQLEDDKQKYKGNPHDLIGFDEVSDFSESQYSFIIGWNRSANQNQRCRVVAAGNPPTRPEGLWVLRRWAAWLDPQHPNPAEPGELRWYSTNPEGEDTELPDGGQFVWGEYGEPVYDFDPSTVNPEDIVKPRSRTFIPAKLSDNPDLAATGYGAVLAALPEEIRAAYRDGRFDVGLKDDAFQTIPTAWVKAAQARWTGTPPVGVPLCCMGVDIAQGGNDNTVIASRHDGWFAPLLKYPGKETPDGKAAAGKVIQHRRDSARVVIDIGGGWGGDAYAHLKQNGVDVVSYMGVKKSSARTVDRTLKFTNIRSEAIWRMREALDPSQPGGSPIMLPPSATLVADLCAPAYSVGPNGIQVESKEDVCKRLGRSTDEGDAVVMCWFDGIKNSNIPGGFASLSKNRAPKVVMRKR